MAIGDLFKKVAGKSPSEFSDLIEIEREVQKVLGKALVVEPFKSGLVPKRGNIFEVVPYQGDLDKDLDVANERIKRICHP